MRGNGMDLLWRILAALSFDCFKDSASSQRSPGKLSSSQAGSLESSSLTGSLSLGPDLPHCQCCISYEARLKRLSCGHLYCDPCTDQIVNLAFEDIEGLSDYPCPMCKSLRQLGDLGPPLMGTWVPPLLGHVGPCSSRWLKSMGAAGGKTEAVYTVHQGVWLKKQMHVVPSPDEIL